MQITNTAMDHVQQEEQANGGRRAPQNKEQMDRNEDQQASKNVDHEVKNGENEEQLINPKAGRKYFRIKFEL
jgi:hypothetical protein